LSKQLEINMHHPEGQCNTGRPLERFFERFLQN